MIADPHLQRALDLLDAGTRDFTADDWADAPPGRWSRAAVVEHLGKTYAGTAHLLDACVSDGVARGRPPQWRQRLFTWLIVDAGLFPTGAKAPAVTIPEGLSGPDALAFARRSLETFDQAATRCLGAFGPSARVVSHPMLGGFTVGQWRRFHWSHTRHHIRQISRRR